MGRSIKDNNGIATLATATSTGKDDTSPIAVTMPLAAGMSCDHLEFRGTNVAVTKSVDKNNNGKQFKITRLFLQKTAFASIGSTTTVACANGDCHGAVAGVDSVVFGGASCDAKTTAETNYPFTRTSNSVTLSGVAAATTVGFVDAVEVGTGSNCESSYIARHVITLDSMPTASATTIPKNLLYSSPVGSCSVSETTKGTYESYECSNRVHVMVKVVYVHVTKVTPANPAKHKQFWFKFAKKTSLNSKQKENVFHICGTIYIYKVDLKK